MEEEYLTNAIKMLQSSLPTKFKILVRVMRRRITTKVAIATVIVAYTITLTARESSWADISDKEELTICSSRG
jgi:hypothetical protein